MGFAAVGELGPKLVIHDSPPEVAVCLLPGTELAFDENVQYDRAFKPFWARLEWITRSRASGRSMRKIRYVQHDALEFPNGQVLKIAQLVAGQTATVLQLPVATSTPSILKLNTLPALYRFARRLESGVAQAGNGFI